MGSQAALRVLAILGVLANAGAVYQFGNDQPWLFLVFPLVVVAVLAAPYLDRLLAYARLRELLAKSEERLREERVQPDLLIAFDRSSAIFAGMLAQRLGVSETLALPRAANPNSSGRREIVVGRGINVDSRSEGARDFANATVVVFHLRTGATLQAGLDALGGAAVFPGRILVLYATEGALAHWPNVLYVQKVSAAEPPQDDFPWIKGAYLHR